MKSYKNSIFFLITVLAVLFQLAHPTVVYADDEPPILPTDVAIEGTPPATEEAPAETALTEATPVLEESSESALPAAETTATPPEEEAPLLEALETLPAETEIVVLDESGEVVPLATQEAAEILTENDPMWCPAGAAVVTDDCVNATTVTALLPLLNSKDQNGVIYFTSSYTTNDVTFDGTNANLDQLADNNLSLQGGWDGATTMGSTINYTGGSVFSGEISITNWNAQITINEITTPTIVISDTTISDASGNGISITKSYHSNVVIDHVTITGLQNGGDALAVEYAGNITITDSRFNNNGVGLYSWFSGPLTITNSQFNNNIVGLSGSDSGPVTITNSQFNNNRGNGFSLDDSGAITVTNSQFNNNGGGGLHADCRTIQVTNSQFNGNGSAGLVVHDSGDVTITNSRFNSNGRDGMYVHDVENITVAGSSFNDNGDNGLYTIEWGHDVYDLRNVTIVNSYFDNNAGTGVEVSSDEQSTIGAITLDGVNANGNGNTGITIHDLNAPAITINDVTAPTVMIGNVTISNAPGNGISITNSPGSNAMINHVAVTGSQSNGFYADHVKDITVTDSQFNDNTLYGLVASHACSLSISSTTFSGNGSGDYLVSYADCEDDPKPPSPAYEVTSHEKAGLDVDCSRQTRYDVQLPNGDRVQLVCPFSGNPRIWHMDNTTLPADLPVGNTYTSALALEIWQDGAAIQHIREGGRINLSFEVPSQEPGTTYSILYWDNGTWVPLKDFGIDENGHPRIFSLYPEDPRQILSGVQFVQKYGSLRAEVSTNFPGIFVLVH